MEGSAEAAVQEATKKKGEGGLEEGPQHMGCLGGQQELKGTMVTLFQASMAQLLVVEPTPS